MIRRHRAAQGLRRAGRGLGAAVLGALLSLAGAPGAFADCPLLNFSQTPGIVDWRGATGSGYDVFDANDHVQPVNLTVAAPLGGSCSYAIGAVVFTDGGNVQNRTLLAFTGALPFNVYVDSARSSALRDLPAASASELIVGSFNASRSASNTHQYYFDVSPAQVVAPGLYQNIVQFRLYQLSSTGNATLMQAINVLHRANAQVAAEVSLVPPGSTFDPSQTAQSVDFGVLKSGLQTNWDVRARGNNGFDISVRSQNQGELLPLTDPGGFRDQIPYTLKIGGQTVDLSSAGGQSVATVNGVTSASGLPFPLSLTIGHFHNADPGRYGDVISIVVTAH